MPKDNIDKAIKRASGKDGALYNEVNYEAKGPQGSLLFIETATDNTNRTVANLKMILNKNNAEMVATGSLEFMFSRKAVIQFQKQDGMDMDEIELELIDHGLEELSINEETVYVYGDFKSFGSLTAAIESFGIGNVKANLQRIPNSPVQMNEKQIEEVEALIDKIEDDDDVQAVFTNIA
jgi:YebC/PmpR family DNA-binding regulatory protein